MCNRLMMGRYKWSYAPRILERDVVTKDGNGAELAKRYPFAVLNSKDEVVQRCGSQQSAEQFIAAQTEANRELARTAG